MKRRHFFSAVAALAASPVVGKSVPENGPEIFGANHIVGRIITPTEACQLTGYWYGPVIGNCIDAPRDAE